MIRGPGRLSRRLTRRRPVQDPGATAPAIGVASADAAGAVPAEATGVAPAEAAGVAPAEAAGAVPAEAAGVASGVATKAGFCPFGGPR
jgi:hypothetical protein